MPLSSYFKPIKYVQRLRQLYHQSRWDAETVHTAEVARFAAWGFDYEAALAKLNPILIEMSGRPFNHVTGTDSIHWVLFSAISLSTKSIHRILEIGTFRGKTTRLLATLFPEAHVTTVELPRHDPILRATYRRDTEEQYQEYLNKRTKNLSHPRITLIETNSFFVPERVEPGFDLIWMDGGHNWPEVGWDICNAWHLARRGALIMCDDVIPNPRGGDAAGADQSHIVLQYLAQRVDLRIDYFLKRENPAWSAVPLMRKYVALFEKP